MPPRDSEVSIIICDLLKPVMTEGLLVQIIYTTVEYFYK